MNTETDFPETLIEAITYFSNPDNAHNFMVSLRWPNGVCCPRCGSDKICAIPTRRTWECKACTEKKQFSVKVGTIFEDSPLPLYKWLATIWLIANAKNGVSSYEVHRAIGVTQKTAWFMLQRIRLAMQTGTFDKLKGEVEVDETYIGGLARNMHHSRNKRRGLGRTGGSGKSVVVGLLERNGEVKVSHVPNYRRSTLHPIIKQNVAAGSEVFTDALPSYEKLGDDYVHKVIDHAEAYVRENVHTNGLENFWSLLKRTLKGTYVSVDPVHLFRYLDEQVFRFNNRKFDDAARFLKAAANIIGKRITYDQLTAKPNVA
jgi:transposase-like protein